MVVCSNVLLLVCLCLIVCDRVWLYARMSMWLCMVVCAVVCVFVFVVVCCFRVVVRLRAIACDCV